MSVPENMVKKRLRKAWGWGPKGDQSDPFTRLGKRVIRDARETVSDIKDEPAEVPYRIRERLRGYFPWVGRTRQ